MDRFPKSRRIASAISAGLRVQEACDLTTADIDLLKGFIFVQEGKGGKDRTVPVNQETVELGL